METKGCDNEKTLDINSNPLPTFPGPCLVLNSPIYGNYCVASRPITQGELIIREAALMISPYGPSDLAPFCFGYHQDIDLNAKAKCPICKWPLCVTCQQNAKTTTHAKNECSILSTNSIKPKGLLLEYFAIETLRCLLLSRNNAESWARVLQFENHSEARKATQVASETLEFITKFIQEKCGLEQEFSSDAIDHVVGVLSVNTFASWDELGMHSSVLFDKVTLFSHDCDPNTERQMILLEPDEGNTQIKIGMEVRASRPIKEGEMVSIRYISQADLNFLNVIKRKEELSSLFYFDCGCIKCKSDLWANVLEKEMEHKLKLGSHSL